MVTGMFSGELLVSGRAFLFPIAPVMEFPLEVTPVTAQSSAPLEVSCYNEARFLQFPPKRCVIATLFLGGETGNWIQQITG